jgi:hypothetical protein
MAGSEDPAIFVLGRVLNGRSLRKPWGADRPNCPISSKEIRLRRRQLASLAKMPKGLMDELAQDDLAQRVCERGWLHLRATASGCSLAVETLDLAQLLGEPIAGRGGAIIEALAPSHVEAARTNSLSMEHGLGIFPLHIDGSHRAQPPRFVILACVRPGFSPAPTVLVHFRDLRLSDAEQRKCETAVFLIRNGKRSFYSTILDRSRPFIRFDQSCMKPASLESREAMKTITLRAKDCLTAINWHAADILVIDNWRVLHGRGVYSSMVSTDRKILRVSIR